MVRAMPIARQQVAKHIPATTNTSVAMQRAVNTTIEEDVFSMDPPHHYISIPVVNHESVVEGEREWSESIPVLVVCEVGRLAIAL
jgi:hypothetical protein